MHRLMVSSATYRQGSIAPKETRQLDPDNLRFSRHARKRLDGESLRDALLAVSGRLNRELGGPCVFPELPPELTRLSSHGAIWPVSTRLADRDRRSLYVFVRRNLRFPLFEAFDKPDTNASCPKRAVTTIAPQALALFNGPLANSCAADLAKRVEAEVPDLSTRIDRAYRRALGRSPDAAERALGRRILEDGDLRRLLPGAGQSERVCLRRVGIVTEPTRQSWSPFVVSAASPLFAAVLRGR